MTGSQSAILSASQKLSPLVQGRKGLYSLSSSLQHNFWRGFVGAIKKFWAAAVSEFILKIFVFSSVVSPDFLSILHSVCA